jgi:hypothetical protein
MREGREPNTCRHDPWVKLRSRLHWGLRSYAYTDTLSHMSSDIDADGDTYKYPNGNAYSYTYSDADGYAHSHANRDTDSNTHADTDASPAIVRKRVRG